MYRSLNHFKTRMSLSRAHTPAMAADPAKLLLLNKSSVAGYDSAAYTNPASRTIVLN